MANDFKSAVIRAAAADFEFSMQHLRCHPGLSMKRTGYTVKAVRGESLPSSLRISIIEGTTEGGERYYHVVDLLDPKSDKVLEFRCDTLEEAKLLLIKRLRRWCLAARARDWLAEHLVPEGVRRLGQAFRRGHHKE